jgi:hypothetical protein
VAASGLLQAEHYRWLYRTLRDLIEQVARAGASAVDAGYAAHVLLGALRPDLLDELLAYGETPQTIRNAQAALARRILD